MFGAKLDMAALREKDRASAEFVGYLEDVREDRHETQKEISAASSPGAKARRRTSRACPTERAGQKARLRGSTRGTPARAQAVTPGNRLRTMTWA